MSWGHFLCRRTAIIPIILPNPPCKPEINTITTLTFTVEEITHWKVVSTMRARVSALLSSVSPNTTAQKCASKNIYRTNG